MEEKFIKFFKFYISDMEFLTYKGGMHHYIMNDTGIIRISMYYPEYTSTITISMGVFINLERYFPIECDVMEMYILKWFKQNKHKIKWTERRGW